MRHAAIKPIYDNSVGSKENPPYDGLVGFRAGYYEVWVLGRYRPQPNLRLASQFIAGDIIRRHNSVSLKGAHP
jgi:hypothetical protein